MEYTHDDSYYLMQASKLNSNSLFDFEFFSDPEN